MVTRSTILQRLPAFTNKVETLEQNQGVQDIMQGIKQWHKKFASHYDKIFQYFIGSTPEQTCKNVFRFLKNNCKYVMEPVEVQTVRGPAAIVATGNTLGIDCKNYSLFIGGVLDAVNRSGAQHIPYVYRFASYDFTNSEAEHVFVVAYPGSENEIWIDPVLDQFNQRTPAPYYFTDKKFKAMLNGISGVPGKQVAGFDFGNILSTGADFIVPGGGAIVDIAGNIFGGMFGGVAGEYNVNEDVQEILQSTPFYKDDLQYLINAIPGLAAQLPIAKNLMENGKNAAQRARGKSFYEAYQAVIQMFQDRIAQLQGGSAYNTQQQQNTASVRIAFQNGGSAVVPGPVMRDQDGNYVLSDGKVISVKDGSNVNAGGGNNNLLLIGGAALLALKFL